MKNSFGIDALSFYTSNYYLDLQTLAAARNIAVDKFYNDLGQKKIAISPPGEDIVTLATNAAVNLFSSLQIDKRDIALLLFATESGADCSKAAGMYLHQFLSLPAHCRVVELKQACYSATAGLQLAMPFLRQNPDKKVLLIAADVARYELFSAAESSQGCGAVAMLLAANPRLLAIEEGSGVCAREVMDFWRPNYRDSALVDGALSCEAYLKMLKETWRDYRQISGRDFTQHDYFCYHTPVPKLVESAHRSLLKMNACKDVNGAMLEQQVSASLLYGREIGNIYTGSLYLSIASLLENSAADLGGKRLGLYSYGSGSVAEYFSAIVAHEYRSRLTTDLHRALLAQRAELSYRDYEDFYAFKLPQDGSNFVVSPQYKTGCCRLEKLEQHKRIYKYIAKQIGYSPHIAG